MYTKDFGNRLLTVGKDFATTDGRSAASRNQREVQAGFTQAACRAA
jgi:hypothetical protein